MSSRPMLGSLKYTMPWICVCSNKQSSIAKLQCCANTQPNSSFVAAIGIKLVTLPVQEQVGKGGAPAEQQGTGIVLRRKKRDDSSSSKAGDALAIAEMVQKLCQVSN